MKTTEKKTVTIKFTVREAEWLYKQLSEIRRINHVASATPAMLEEGFMAKSLQDRIDSES
jgi:hypothetical protein